MKEFNHNIVKIVTSRKGVDMTFYKGYKYNKRTEDSAVGIWRCRIKGYRGKLHTTKCLAIIKQTTHT